MINGDHTSIFRRSQPPEKAGQGTPRRQPEPAPRVRNLCCPACLFLTEPPPVSETHCAACPGAAGSLRQLAGTRGRGSGTRDPGSGIRLSGAPARKRGSSRPRLGAGTGGAGRRGCPGRAGRGRAFSPGSAPSPGWSAAPPRPLPPACAAGSGGGAGARTRGGEGRGAAPRAGPGGRALAAGAARAAPRAARGGRSPGLGPPILLRRGECDGRSPGVRLYPCLPGSGAGSERPRVCGASVGGGTDAFRSCDCLRAREACPCPWEPRGHSLGCGSHVRSMFEGGRRGWMGDGSSEERGVWEPVYVGGGSRSLRAVAVAVEGGGWGC